ncbi:MAG: glycoside hydrolase family 78 protein [Armatimonadetes bacterium]|nr:glycoside hydrolase family 78 protein [Armatimonadota bacterium]
MDWKAKWIWQADDASPRNMRWCARKEFVLPAACSDVRVDITADSRYSLWVNGRYVGHGPVRAFTNGWRYDTYDATPYLNEGPNAIAVLVEHFGHSTFQCLEARSGLLAQIECDGNVVAATDATWKSLVHPSYSRRTPRISCQQGWVEHFDARVEPVGWTIPGFDDSAWDSPVVVGEAGCEPWSKLLPRDIPHLTQEPIYADRLMASRVVRPPKQVRSMDLKPNLIPGDLSANPAELPGIAATILKCMEPVRVSITTFHNNFKAVRIDGEEVSWDSAKSGIDLGKGEHLLLIDLSGRAYHEWFATLIFECAGDGLELASPLGKGAPYQFVTVGPFAVDERSGLEAVLRSREAGQIAGHPLVKPILLEHTVPDHVAALTALAHQCEDGAQILEPNAMLSATDDVTTITPSPGGDTELLIDFGRMLVGHVEMDLWAPEGAIIDFNGIENITDGHIQWPGSGLNNTNRYTARRGWQRWRSVVRRGFRYVSLSIRFPDGCVEPVRLKSIRCNLSTYPYANRGAFNCSDELLNRAWEISRWTVRLCSEDTFVDCPTYEQAFWVGDARNEGLFSYTAFGDYKLARRSLLLAGESLRRSPLVESQVPSGWQNILTAWSLLWTVACEEYYRFSGDHAFLEEIYPAVRKQNSNIHDLFMNPQGLFEIQAWNMLDWAQMDTPERGVITHQNMWLVEALRRSAAMALALGKRDDASSATQAADALRDTINRHLWNDDKQAYVDCIHEDGTPSKIFSQQTQTIAHLCGIVPPERRELFERYLTSVPDDWVKIGSPFMMAFTLESLEKAGDIDSIVKQIRQWWGMMIQDGATACWETFQSALGDSWPTRSYCHAWSAAPAFALPAYVLGVQPIEPGFAKFSLRPYLGDLAFAGGIVPTPSGEVHVEIRRDDGVIIITFSVPPGTVAVLQGTEYGTGIHEVRY